MINLEKDLKFWDDQEKHAKREKIRIKKEIRRIIK